MWHFCFALNLCILINTLNFYSVSGEQNTIRETKNITLSKCCGRNEILLFPNCVRNTLENNSTDGLRINHLLSKFKFLNYNKTCRYGMYKLPKNYWYLTDDNNVNILRTFYQDDDNICIDSKNPYDSKEDVEVYICIQGPYKRTILEFILNCASCVSFLMTIYVYSLPFLKKRHGKCTICYLGTLGFALTFYGLQYPINLMQKTVFSVIIAYLSLYCFLANVMWLNVIIYDVLDAVCKISKKQTSNERKQEVKTKLSLNDSEDVEKKMKFRNYCWIAFYVPVIIVIVTLICDNISSIFIRYRPNISMQAGWFSEYILLDGTKFVIKSKGEMIYLLPVLLISSPFWLIGLIITTLKFNRIRNFEKIKFGISYNPGYTVLKSYRQQVILNWYMYLSSCIAYSGKFTDFLMGEFQWYTVNREEIYNFICFTYILYACEGLLLFILLVLCRPKVMKNVYDKLITNFKKLFKQDKYVDVELNEE